MTRVALALVALLWASPVRAMPVYHDIASFPYSHTVTLVEFNGPPNEVWFRFVAPTGTNAIGWKTGTSGATVLTTRLFETNTSNLVTFTNTSAAFWYLPLIAGDTYYVQVLASGAIGSTFDVTADLAPVDPAIAPGTRLINDDHDGFAGTIWSPTGTFLGFSTTLPAGESGDALPSGVSIWHSGFAAAGSRIKVLAADLSVVATTDTSPSVSEDTPVFANDGTKFWVLNNGIGNKGKVYSISATGTVSTLVATVPGSPIVSGIGVNSAGTVLYWVEGSTSRAIHRHNLSTDSALSDFYSVPAGPTVALAYAANSIIPGEILVLSDGSLVTWYRDSTNSKDVLIHVNSGGVLSHSYDYAHPIEIDHISYHPDSPNAINIWFHLDATGSGALGRLGRLALATGTLTDDVYFDQFVNAESISLTGTDVFGASNSCTMVAPGYGSGTIEVTKVTVPDGSTQSFDFTDGGGLSPTTFDLIDGETQSFTVAPGSGYSVTETPIGGWSASITVSNGSSPDNISVAAAETVVVTVTNTQAMPPETSPPPCCSANEPGYSGSGPGGPTGSNPPPTPPLTTPRIVPEGGEAPTYVSCSAGGGRPATASDPTDAQNLTSAKTPLVHMKWTLPDASVRRYGKADFGGGGFTSGNGQFVSKRVLKWGPTRQVLSDRHGSFQANSFTVQLSDYDRSLRTILSTTSTKYIDGKEIELLIETKANAALSVNPLVLSRGIITGYKFNRDLTVDVTVTDPLGYRYSSTSLDRPIPYRVIGPTFPGCAETSVGRAVPIIYGEMSDDYSWSIDPARIPVGIVPVIHVGKANLISAVGIPSSEWEAFVVCGHALTCVQSVFASNLEPEGEGSVRMSSSTYGSEFLVPGINVPLYYDIVGTDGVTQRFCLFFATGERAVAHITGKVPITLNVFGIEDVGDGSGDTISEIAYQYQHFLQSWVLTNYMSGNWPAVPTFTDGTAKVRTSSFDTVNATHAARLGTDEGYNGAMYIGDQKPAREHNKEFMIGGDMRTGVNHQGQVLAITVKDTSPTTGLTTYTATDHVVQDSFEISPAVDEIFNVYTYEYGPEPATTRISGIAQTIRDTVSVTNHSERIAQALLYRTTRQKPTADDVAGRTLLRSANAPTDVTFSLDLRGVTLSLGQLIRITHYQGIGVSGWTSRVLMVTGITTHPDEDDFSTEIEAEDVNELLDAGALALALDDGRIDLSRVA